MIQFENWFNRPLDNEKDRMFAFNLFPDILVIYQTDGFLSISFCFLFWILTYEKQKKQ